MQLLLVLHSLVRWVILLVGLWTLINALTGVMNKRSFSAGDNRSNLLFMIFWGHSHLHRMLLLLAAAL